LYQSPGPAPEGTVALSLDQLVSDHICQTLARCRGRVEGEKGAARLLKIHPSTLRKRMKKLNIPFGRVSPYKRGPKF